MLNYVETMIVWNLVIWFAISILPEGWLAALIQINYFQNKRFLTLSIVNLVLGAFMLAMIILFYIYSFLIIKKVF